MSTREEDQERIEKELRQFPKKWVVAFAARCSAQCLPGLLEKKNPEDSWFAYWPKDKRQQHLFAVLRTNVLAAAFASINDANFIDATIHTASLAVHSAHNANAFANASIDASSFAVHSAYNGIFNAYATTIVDVARAAASAAFNTDLIGVAIGKELGLLKEKVRYDISPAEYLQHPLYASQSQKLLQHGKKFVQVLRNVGSGFDIWADWFQGCIDGVPADREFIEAVVNLPLEILAQEPAHINAYMKNFCRTERTLNRVRVIFLGYGEVGKTSLIRALNGLEVIVGEEQMTAGIDISTWQVPDTKITAHFWDFGGQVVAHATHQFFLRSNCLYVLLLDGRTVSNANEEAEYWLEHVRAFGSKAPVMLVGNKADLCQVNLDMATLKEKHKNMLDFYRISCTKYKDEFALEFQRFQKDLSKAIAGLSENQIRFGKAHLAVLDELTNRSNKESFLQKTAWLDLCKESGLAEHGDLNQNWLLDILDKLGVIVHFPNIAALDSYILNPRWLTYGVYTLLYSLEAQKKKGRLRKAEIISILSAAKVSDNIGNLLAYPPEKADIIIQAMEEFKLCFPYRHERGMIIIPALLESDQPKHDFNKKDSFAFEFDFTGFLPRHIMPNFIVGRHDEIKDELVWQYGVVLQRKDESAEALVQVDYHARKLALWLNGPKANDYFKIIYDDLDKILDQMPELRSRINEYVIVPESSRIGEPPRGFRLAGQPIRADFGDLLVLEEKRETEYTCKAGTFDLGKILRIMTKKARDEYRQQNNITVKGDMIMGDQPTKTDSSISVGKGATVHGSIIAGSTIENSFNTVAQSAAEPALKAELERLCKQVEQMLTKLPEEKKENAAKDLDDFVKEAAKEKPEKRRYQFSAEGLIEAAKACAGMAEPVTKTVKAILGLLA